MQTIEEMQRRKFLPLVKTLWLERAACFIALNHFESANEDLNAYDENNYSVFAPAFLRNSTNNYNFDIVFDVPRLGIFFDIKSLNMLVDYDVIDGNTFSFKEIKIPSPLMSIAGNQFISLLFLLNNLPISYCSPVVGFFLLVL